MTDQRICGYGLADEGLCRELQAVPDSPEQPWCEKHNEIRWSVCRGCGKQAVGECAVDAPSGLCRIPLCGSCEHVSATSAENVQHRPPEQVDDAAWTPEPSAEAQRITVRQQMIDMVVDSLTACVEREMITIPDGDLAERVAGVVIDDLTAKITLQVLSGIAGVTR